MRIALPCRYLPFAPPLSLQKKNSFAFPAGNGSKPPPPFCILFLAASERANLMQKKGMKKMGAQKKHYDIEKEGQQDFFDNFHIDYRGDASVLVDNTDGVYHGNILEFKLNISNTGRVLFQAIKYLSRMRIKGESVPARILLIDLNATKVYVYESKDYLNDIQKAYVGAASKGNDAFAKDITPAAAYDYSDMVDADAVQKLLANKTSDEKCWYVPIDLDENCIVGWAERYYREVPKATKGDFLGDGTGKLNLKGEIRDPKHFEGLINPYKEATNEKFKYLMDCLNDRLNKKDLGAFYTPEAYCEKAAELVEMAVARVPDGNDYIILDRCAGSGNLEAALYGRYDKNGDELITHCVVSTYEYYEYKVLLERIGADVRNIIPPTEANVIYENGKISNADAMSKEYIKNPLIRQYIDNPKCTIIMFENPPYRDQSQKNNKEDKADRTHTDKSYVRQKMKETNMYGLAINDILNLFVWSAWKYYLRQPLDSYIIFAPIKHWKRIGISNKCFVKGYIFNRKHFHASSEAISCLYLINEEAEEEQIILPAMDIDSKGDCIYERDITVSKSHVAMSKLFDKRKFATDDKKAICCNRDGTEAFRDCRFVPYYNQNIIAYLRAESYGFDANSVCLVRNGLYNGNGFYLRRDKYLKGLPLFCAKQFPFDEWYFKNMIDTTADGGDAYTKDESFLKSCLIYTCLSNQNKCLSFTGSDGRFYKNELCFDTTNGETVASLDLKKMALDADEKQLLSIWNNVLSEAKKTQGYNKDLTYGVYQISKELNTSHKEGRGTSERIVYDYPALNSYLISLRDNLKAYYKSHITAKMFKYELLK